MSRKTAVSADMVSVIIPAFNAEKTLRSCLDSLMNQDYSDDYEVIVIDDGSTDLTPRIVQEFEKVRLIKQSNAGPAVARNRGAAEAKGDIILFTDSDCTPERNWISEMLKPFNNYSELVGVKGSYRTRQKEITARFVQLEYEDKYDYMAKDKYIDFIDTYSAAFKKDVFIEMKGYDSEFPVACAEDVELSYRLSNKGYKMVFNPDALVYHVHPDRFWSYLKKKYKFAYWRMLAVKNNPNKAIKDSHTPKIMKMQLLVPPALFGGALISVYSESGLYIVFLLMVVFVISTAPFTFRALKGGVVLGILSPLLLFFRAFAQFCGVSGGLLYLLLKR